MYILFPVPKEIGSPPTVPVPKEVVHCGIIIFHS